MIWLVIPLAILGIAASSTMDEIRFHWNRIFAHWFPRPTDGSVYSPAERWFNPSVSHLNKYMWTDNKYLQWFLKSPLVFITDFWHLCKFILLNCLYGIITLLMIEYADVTIHWGWLMLGMNLGWGFIYETVSSVYGLLHDRKTFK
jgi:hypothetical protein